jgi:hypothetical protein
MTRGWQDEVLDQWPAGIDGSLIEERLRLTPTERLERLRAFLEFLDAARGRRGDPLPHAS